MSNSLRMPDNQSPDQVLLLLDPSGATKDSDNIKDTGS